MNAELELAWDPRERSTQKERENQPAPPRRQYAVWVALAVVALGVGDCARLVLGSQMAPRDQDWQAAVAAVRQGFQKGDLIVAAPRWSDPVMRLHLGDLVGVDMAARPDSDRYGRVWEVSTRGAEAPETAPPASCTTIVQGRVRVRRCDRPAARVIYDFADHLASDARAAVVHGGQEQPCTWSDGRFACAGTSVGPIIGEIEYEPHRCILAPAPLRPGDPVRIEWQQVPLGSRLVGYTGIHSFYARKSGHGPVAVKISIDGHEALSLVHQNSDGWRRFEVPTTDHKGRRASVRVDISSAEPADRKLCFALEARE